GATAWTHSSTRVTQGFFVQFAVYLVAATYLLRLRGPASRGLLIWIVAIGVLLRLISFWPDPRHSDDLYRYIWDGKLINAGLNPYLYPADDPALAHLRGPTWPGIADKWNLTPYQPLSELAFGLAYRLAGESFKSIQALGLLADLAVLGLISLLLPLFGHDRRRLLIYAWHPLPILHFAHSGHNDALMMAGLLATIYLAARGRPGWSGVAFASTVLAKLYGLVLAPILLRHWGWRGVAAGLLAGLILYAPFLPGGPAIFLGLTAEAGDRIFNDGPQYVLRWFIQLFVDDGRPHARYLAGLTVLGAGIWFLLRRDPRPAAFWERSYVQLGLLIYVSAMVQPWYVAWMIPFLCLALRRGSGWFPFALQPALGWLLWSGTVELTDYSYIYGRVIPNFWLYLRAIQYLPLTLLLAWAGWQTSAAQRLRHALFRRHKGADWSFPLSRGEGWSERVSRR
ncbi:MAG TPA: glycosyltransferase family 87 protein, partial [Dehalococcoidia bacterium]|nr:glycosyltransferase family 87 protein [Dehalococcoidia bacterium]